MKNLNAIRTINADIADYIERTYADISAALIDVPSPHALAHQIAANYPGLGAAFYRMVAEAAREALSGGEREEASAPPSVSPSLAGLINSKDSSWF